MKNREEVQKELKELSPFLSKLKAQEQKPEVPENYFHALPDQIWEQIKLQPAPQRAAQAPSMREKLRTALQVLLQPRLTVSLATFALLMVAGIYFVQLEGTATAAVKQELSADDIALYIENNLYEFDTELLIEAAADLPKQSLILPTEEWEEQEVDQLMEEILKDLDTKTLEEML